MPTIDKHLPALEVQM